MFLILYHENDKLKGEYKMTEKNEKKGLFQRLTSINITPKSSCCSIELEEIPEKSTEKQKSEKKEKKNSCCS